LLVTAIEPLNIRATSRLDDLFENSRAHYVFIHVFIHVFILSQRVIDYHEHREQIVVVIVIVASIISSQCLAAAVNISEKVNNAKALCRCVVNNKTLPPAGLLNCSCLLRNTSFLPGMFSTKRDMPGSRNTHLATSITGRYGAISSFN